MMTAARPATVIAALRGRAQRPDYPETARGLDIPALVLAGSEDVFDQGVLAAGLAGLITDARLAIIPDAGHAPGMETSGAFDIIVQDFLRSTF